jgi:hypothetical protein
LHQLAAGQTLAPAVLSTRPVDATFIVHSDSQKVFTASPITYTPGRAATNLDTA